MQIKILLVILSIALFTAALFKAGNSAITWDEAFTYFEFIRNSHLWPGAGGGMAANNHLLNTWISFFFVSLFGPSEFILRLGNLLFYLVYLMTSAWLALRSRSIILSLAIFSILNFNPYLFDFFCLSRGYGMAHVCLLVSLAAIYQFLISQQSRWLKIFIVTTVTGMLAGAMLLPVFFLLYLMLFFLLPAISLLKEKSYSNQISLRKGIHEQLQLLPLGYHLIFLFASICHAAYLIVFLIFNAYVFGGKKGVAEDMILSVLKNTFYDGHLYIFIAILAACFFLLLMVVMKLKAACFFSWSSPESKMTGIILGCLAGVFIQSSLLFYVFNIPLPAERTALYLYVLFASLMVLLLVQVKEPSTVLHLGAILLIMTMASHFAFCYNIQTFLEWRKDADAPLMIADLRKTVLPHRTERLQAVTSLELEQPLRFYLHFHPAEERKINLSRIGTIIPKADLFFIEEADYHRIEFLLNDKDYRVLRYPQKGVMLYRSY
jgi:hypothetical protein